LSRLATFSPDPKPIAASLNDIIGGKPKPDNLNNLHWLLKK
jgi:hypothetical protein